MVSRTKYPIDEAGVRRLFAAAGMPDVENIAPLGAGEYNAVFSATAGGRGCVVKIAPPPGVPVLSHEKDMMASEVFWYRQMREKTTIRVPEVYFSDFSGEALPAAYFIMEKLEGPQMDKMEFTKEEKAGQTAELARMMAQMHTIKNDSYGYIQCGTHPTWYEAIKSMTEVVMADAAAAGKRSGRGERLLSEIEKHRAVLEKADCRMVNFDVWAGNIICRRTEAGVEYAWIDPERSFWGDRIADFVCLGIFTPLAKNPQAVAAYNEAAEEPVVVGREEEIRYAIAQGHLGLIMEVEKYYRYSPRHFGWWRNVIASKSLFNTAYKVLDNV